MRISIDAGVLLKERSGVGQYLYNLINGLGAIDTTNEYRLLYDSFGKTIRIPPFLPYKNFSYLRLPYAIKLLKLASGLGRLPAFKLLGSSDIFHWPNYLLISGGSGKHVITIHDLSVLLFPTYHPPFRVKTYSLGISRSASKADAILTVSQQTKRDVVKYLGIQEERIRVVYSAASPRFRPISPTERHPILSRYSLTDQKFLLFVGNIEPRKNLIGLVDAYSMLRKRWAHRCPLILVGGKGWRNADIYRRVEELSLAQDVRFLGYVPDEELPALMSAATAFVYPSLYEGFGIPPLEAMACGTPVVTSAVSSLPEVVGDAALQINPLDIDGLAEAMHRMLTDASLREDLRQKGFERVKLFSWEETARQTLKVYEEIYTKRRMS